MMQDDSWYVCDLQFFFLFHDVTRSFSFFGASGNSLGTDMLTEHPLLSEPSPVSFYNWMSNAVGNRTGAGTQDLPVNRSQHNSLQTGQTTLALGLPVRDVFHLPNLIVYFLKTSFCGTLKEKKNYFFFLLNVLL